MEYLKVAADGKASPKREFKHTRSRNQRVVMKSNMLDAFAQASGERASVVSHSSSENGVMKLKIVMKKQDLEEMLQRIKEGKNVERVPRLASNMQSLCLEQRINILKRRLRPNHNHVKRGSWKPLLHSIPE